MLDVGGIVESLFWRDRGVLGQEIGCWLVVVMVVSCPPFLEHCHCFSGFINFIILNEHLLSIVSLFLWEFADIQDDKLFGPGPGTPCSLPGLHDNSKEFGCSFWPWQTPKPPKKQSTGINTQILYLLSAEPHWCLRPKSIFTRQPRLKSNWHTSLADHIIEYLISAKLLDWEIDNTTLCTHPRHPAAASAHLGSHPWSARVRLDLLTLLVCMVWALPGSVWQRLAL